MRKSLFLSIALVAVGFFVLAVPAQTSAEGLVPCGGSPRCCESPTITTGCTNPDQPLNPTNCDYRCKFCDIFVLVNNIIKFLLVPNVSLNSGFPIVSIIASLYIVIGGFWMVFRSTNEQDYKKGKDMVWAVVAGMLVIFASWAFLNTIFTQIGIAQWTGLGTWWTIVCH